MAREITPDDLVIEYQGDYCLSVCKLPDAQGCYPGKVVDSDWQPGEDPQYAIGWPSIAGALYGLRLSVASHTGQDPELPPGCSLSEAQEVRSFIVQSMTAPRC